jgi:hypothetical protein
MRLVHCPICKERTYFVIVPPQGLEPYGIAYATCRDQRVCGWRSAAIPTAGDWERDLELRVVRHTTTVRTGVREGKGNIEVTAWQT